MSHGAAQRGVAMFTAIFLIVVIAILGGAIALLSAQQQVGTAQSLSQTRVYYAALGGLDRAIGAALGGGCGAVPGSVTVGGIAVTLTCTPTTGIQEGSSTYDVYALGAVAATGSKSGGTLARRTLRAQVSTAP